MILILQSVGTCTLEDGLPLTFALKDRNMAAAVWLTEWLKIRMHFVILVIRTHLHMNEPMRI